MKENFIPDIQNPLALFKTWYSKAEKSEPSDPNAMCLSTVNGKGQPSSRMVLLKDYSSKGFIFYTNYESRKGRQIFETGKAALNFHWKSMDKQVRIEGSVVTVPPKTADAYFASRPRGSQIGAWASKQSRPLSSRSEFEERIEKYTKEFEGHDVPRPPHWSGFCLVPSLYEFWQHMPSRLHDRVEFKRDGKRWKRIRLYP